MRSTSVPASCLRCSADPAAGRCPDGAEHVARPPADGAIDTPAARLCDDLASEVANLGCLECSLKTAVVADLARLGRRNVPLPDDGVAAAYEAALWLLALLRHAREMECDAAGDRSTVLRLLHHRHAMILVSELKRLCETKGETIATDRD